MSTGVRGGVGGESGWPAAVVVQEHRQPGKVRHLVGGGCGEVRSSILLGSVVVGGRGGGGRRLPDPWAVAVVGGIEVNKLGWVVA